MLLLHSPPLRFFPHVLIHGQSAQSSLECISCFVRDSCKHTAFRQGTIVAILREETTRDSAGGAAVTLLNESAVFAGILNVATQAVLAHEMWVSADSPAAIQHLSLIHI